MTKQTDARGTIITFSPYDALNRLQTKTYTLGTDTAATSSVCYKYDYPESNGALDFKGALASVKTYSGSGTCSAANDTITTYAHDGFGRIKSSAQTTGSNGPYAFAYEYSLTDQLTQITYSSMRKVGYELDAADRVKTVQNKNAGTNYASVNYTAPGGISTMALGNNVTESLTWNDRAQPKQLQATSPSSSALLTLGLYPCAGNASSCSSGNNGNLRSQTVAIPNLSVTQTYGYDNLNRLTNATETGGTGWSQTYHYDGNGNRWIPPAENQGLPPLTLETPQAGSWYSASNRITGWSYDAAGNVLQVGGMSRSFTYDAENRQASAAISSATTTYTYDGNGLRVSKTAPNGQKTIYAYDAFGNLAVEYGTATASACGTPTCYVTVDHLGTTRMLTDNTGANPKRYDYLPFGGEITARTDGLSGGRTAAMGYALDNPDGLNPKFTGRLRAAPPQAPVLARALAFLRGGC